MEEKPKKKYEIADKRKPGRKPMREEDKKVRPKSDRKPGRPSTGFNKKEYDNSHQHKGVYSHVEPDALAAKNRAFSAIEYIIENKIDNISSFSHFVKAFTLKRVSLIRVRDNDNTYLPIYLLIILVQNFHFSAHWLLTGEGEMIQKKENTDND